MICCNVTAEPFAHPVLNVLITLLAGRVWHRMAVFFFARAWESILSIQNERIVWESRGTDVLFSGAALRRKSRPPLDSLHSLFYFLFFSEITG